MSDASIAGPPASRPAEAAGSRPERRRALAVGLVAVTLVLAGVANSTVHRPGQLRARRVAAAVAPSVATVLASSSAWYCAGPLPVGTTGEASSIAVANLGARKVRGEVVLATSTASRSSTKAVTVPPGGESVVGLRVTGPRGSAAATVVVDGSGVAVEELVHGVRGVTAAPCSDHPAASSYLAAGSTSGADNLSLAVLDPGATPAVVDVSFSTGAGTVSPPAFQGLSIGAGQLQVLDVGHFLPSRTVVATTVTATGGHVVAGALLTAVVGRTLMSSLATGVSASSTSWLMPAGLAGGDASSVFSVLDPTGRPASVQLRLGSASGVSAVLSASVPAHGVVTLTPGVASRHVVMRWASLESRGAGVVVTRETFVVAPALHRPARVLVPARRPPLGRRGRHVAARRVAATTTTGAVEGAAAMVPYAMLRALPHVVPGVAVTSGVSSPSRRWVLPGGESDARTSEVVVVDNTSSAVATVDVQQMDATTGGPATSFATMPPLSVGPGEVLTVDMAAITGADGTMPLVVTADRPVVVGEMLYARKAAGFTLPAAIAVR